MPPPQEGSSDSELSLDSWRVWEEPAPGAGRAVSECLGLNLSTWTEEASPLAMERLQATMSAVAAKLTSGGALRVRGEERRGDMVTQDLVGSGESEGKLAGRALLGFVHVDHSPRLEGCFLLCAPTTAACERALASAAPGPGLVAPPAASAPLRAVVFGIHHARGVLVGAAALFVVLGLVAIWTRPRPRTK
jgi:hypothetical protein